MLQTPEVELLAGAAGAEIDADGAKATPKSAGIEMIRKYMMFPLPFIDPATAVEGKVDSGSSPE